MPFGRLEPDRSSSSNTFRSSPWPLTQCTAQHLQIFHPLPQNPQQSHHTSLLALYRSSLAQRLNCERKQRFCSSHAISSFNDLSRPISPTCRVASLSNNSVICASLSSYYFSIFLLVTAAAVNFSDSSNGSYHVLSIVAVYKGFRFCIHIYVYVHMRKVSYHEDMA